MTPSVHPERGRRPSRGARALLALLALAATASAHDFTDRNVKDLQNAVEVWIGPEQIYVDYWFLFGEIEALGFRQGMDLDHDGKISPAERQAWLEVRKARLDDLGFLVDIDDPSATPTLLSEPVLDTTVDVVGAVPFKLSFELSIPIKDLPPGEHTLRFAALNIQERPAGQRLVLTIDQCEILGGIPEDAKRFSPGTKPFRDAPDTVSSVFEVDRKLAGAQLGPQIYVRFRKPATYETPADPRVGRTAPFEGDKAQEAMLKSLVAKKLTVPVIVAALALAFFWGMGHGFAPGHGKTIVGAYLVGERGNVLHAVLLGIVVTITHLSSVVLMCLVLNWALQKAEGTEYKNSVNYWSQVASGGITFLVGAGLFASRLRGARWERPGQEHGHEAYASHHEEGRPHDHGPGHEHDDHDVEGHGHSHVPKGAGPPSLWAIVWLGISGGIVPCPTAWVLLLLSMQVRRFEWGLLLILAFSLGLALVLIGIGILFVKAKQAVDRLGRGAGLLRTLAVVSPLLIMGLGAFLTWKAVR